MITQERLKELLHYDAETGGFTWRMNKGPFLAGDVAGRTVAKGKYPRIGIDGDRYIASRLAWLYITGKWPVHVMDHIDGNPLNTRFANLRDVMQSKNCFNAGKRSHNTTGYQGVFKDNRNRPGVYFSQTRINGKQTYLGHSDLYGCA